MSGADAVLGINAFHADAAAVLLQAGALGAAIEEERLNRIKHWAGFPAGALAAVLEEGRLALEEVAHAAISRDPKAHLLDKALFAFRARPGLEAIRSRLANQGRVLSAGALLAERGFRGRLHSVEHHRAHLASAFFCSPHDEAACLSVDGFGDFLSSMSAVGRGNRLTPLDEVLFPHSLGIFYTAATQFLGFPHYGDEYKVMGLAAFGEPRFLPQMRGIVRLSEDGGFETALDYFRHASEGVTMSWDGGEPSIGVLWSPKFVERFGEPRKPGAPLTDRDRDMASSLQAMYEEAFFHRLRWLQARTGLKALCLAGGCAMNSVANGKIFDETGFRDVYVQAAAGDAGTALGAALYVWHQILDRPRGFVMEHAYWGAGYDESHVLAALRRKLRGFPGHPGGAWHAEGIDVSSLDDEHLLATTADAIADGKVVGWFQGRSEWGPRALGNRSILADPRRVEMRDTLNARIKRREPFRPFAPAILEERVGDYFCCSYPDPFMTKVYPIRASLRSQIPAVTHVDGTGRLQTVSRRQNALFWQLIKAFESRTSIPILLNTSFNENEPIVNTPEEALDCFLRTRMDRLVMGHWVVVRTGGSPANPAAEPVLPA